MSLIETHHASIVFATGRGVRPPDPPLFQPCKLASIHVRILESHHFVCKWSLF